MPIHSKVLADHPLPLPKGNQEHTSIDQSKAGGPGKVEDDSIIGVNSEPNDKTSKTKTSFLQEEHDIVTNLRSLSQNRQKWKLQHCDLQKPPPPPPLLPHIRASILSSNSKGLNLKEIPAWLSQETNIQVCIQTVKRYLKRLNVKLLVNNVADGTVTMEQVFEAVNHARQTLLHDQAAYRRM
ncbi:hypothetical protein MJO28_008019 [Puccinia striiformis f. sp. tritici]|uniref:Uncharacterized protein n=1 Tax=Puccinia striiformis f. sp. tritici TaxID=168172 RepID=A0ACC0E9V0_9BASI|nr:hypothetical protein MJO28_008019 [Puccinia striiformis f. sp. tritici]